MRYTELLRLYRAAVRNARKINRSLQTESEKLERWMDRNTNAKRPDRGRVLNFLQPSISALKSSVQALDKALADVLGVLNL